ncbi:MAG: hypothetical protein BWX68_02389 [Verrucomicrobia bacterium ADurb.Bin063]|jgi:hypothetical protein|nr:MAG: hypothetical protein BWX68_02389 [Verrucomicrobia bacterium ADurb.Bin063]
MRRLKPLDKLKGRPFNGTAFNEKLDFGSRSVRFYLRRRSNSAAPPNANSASEPGSGM